MRTYTVTEVEKEDWDKLDCMTIAEAVNYLNDVYDIEDWTGSYSYGSTDPDEFRKAQILTAYDKVLDYVTRIMGGI